MAKPTDPGASRKLADRWGPPASLPIGEDAGKPVACIATTYTFHAHLFETDLLPRFLGLRFDSNERERVFVVERERALAATRACVLVDQTHVDGSQSTLRWDQLPVDVPGGAQHAKLSLLLWERCLRVIVSSANLTRTGYRKNREIAASIDFFDAGDSAPRALAIDAIDFLRELADGPWIRAGREAIERFTASLDEMRRRLASWRRMPAEFRPLERPRAVFVGGLPRRPGKRVRAPLTQLLEQWGSGRASEITVLTPVVGESDKGQAAVVEALMRVPRSRDAVGQLIVPGIPSEKNPEQSRVPLPRWFRDVWASAWRQAPDEVSTYVVPQCREDHGEKRLRSLHAKAVVVASEDRVVMLCGSSNFSPHGMGVGAANIEANLCYVDDSGTKIWDSLPVDWDGDFAEAPVWLEVGQPPDDEMAPEKPRLPAVFRSAVLSQQDGSITFLFDTARHLPDEWFMSLPGGAAEQVVLVSHQDVPTMPGGGTQTVSREELKRGVAVTCVIVRWRDAGDREMFGALMPVHAAGAESILPPEEFQALTADQIVLCLISGRAPEELVGPDGGGLPPGPRASTTDIESLRHVDTSRYPTYRSRLLGRALATLASHIIETVRTETAMAHRLFQDPLGPVSLAKAIVSQQEGEAAVAGGVFSRAYTLFALAEIELTLAYTGKQVHANRARYEPDLRRLFRDAIAQVGSLRPEPGASVGDKDSTALYVDQVQKESRRVLNLAGGRRAG